MEDFGSRITPTTSDEGQEAPEVVASTAAQIPTPPIVDLTVTAASALTQQQYTAAAWAQQQAHYAIPHAGVPQTVPCTVVNGAVYGQHQYAAYHPQVIMPLQTAAALMQAQGIPASHLLSNNSQLQGTSAMILPMGMGLANAAAVHPLVAVSQQQQANRRSWVESKNRCIPVVNPTPMPWG